MELCDEPAGDDPRPIFKIDPAVKLEPAIPPPSNILLSSVAKQ